MKKKTNKLDLKINLIYTHIPSIVLHRYGHIVPLISSYSNSNLILFKNIYLKLFENKMTIDSSQCQNLYSTSSNLNFKLFNHNRKSIYRQFHLSQCSRCCLGFHRRRHLRRRPRSTHSNLHSAIPMFSCFCLLDQIAFYFVSISYDDFETIS
jgi:hypothetical protein